MSEWFMGYSSVGITPGTVLVLFSVTANNTTIGTIGIILGGLLILASLGSLYAGKLVRKEQKENDN